MTHVLIVAVFGTVIGTGVLGGLLILLAKFQRRNRERNKLRIVRALAIEGREMSCAEIEGLLQISVGALYPLLAQLEYAGALVSWWEEGPSPRRRLYRLRGKP